jgi:hypothetical protein
MSSLSSSTCQFTFSKEKGLEGKITGPISKVALATWEPNILNASRLQISSFSCWSLGAGEPVAALGRWELTCSKPPLAPLTTDPDADKAAAVERLVPIISSGRMIPIRVTCS